MEAILSGMTIKYWRILGWWSQLTYQTFDAANSSHDYHSLPTNQNPLFHCSHMYYPFASRCILPWRTSETEQSAGNRRQQIMYQQTTGPCCKFTNVLSDRKQFAHIAFDSKRDCSSIQLLSLICQHSCLIVDVIRWGKGVEFWLSTSLFRCCFKMGPFLCI